MNADLTPIMNATVQNAAFLNATFIQSPREGTDWLSILTTLATILLAIFTLFLYLATKKYAEAAKNQEAAMKTQVDVMKAQTGIVQKQSDSAEKQAKAMDDQVMVMTNQSTIMDEQKKISMDQMKYEGHVLRYKRLRDEMDRLVAPLNSIARIGLDYYEPAHVSEKYASEWGMPWRDIRKNAYLASDDLYKAIEIYLIVCEKQYEELKKIRYGIFAIDNPSPKIVTDPAPIDEGFGSYLQKIKELRDEKGSDTDYGKKLNWLYDIVQDGHNYQFTYSGRTINISIKSARISLKEAIESRYETLLKQIKEIEKELGIPITER